MKLGNDSVIAAGSVITKDVGAGSLAIARGQQEVQPGAAERVRANAKARKEQQKKG